MNAPVLNPDGSCPDCLGGWLCQYHQQAGLREDARRAANLRAVVANLRWRNIADTIARHELESDEFFTREEKAAAILRRGQP